MATVDQRVNALNDRLPPSRSAFDLTQLTDDEVNMLAAMAERVRDGGELADSDYDVLATIERRLEAGCALPD
jgi:hypothetical protein